MNSDALIEQLRRKRARLLKVYVLHVGLFASTCASAAADLGQVPVASALWLALITSLPVMIYTGIVHHAIRRIEPAAGSVGPRQIVVAAICFTPLEASLIPPLVNLWIACRILRTWKNRPEPGNRWHRER